MATLSLTAKYNSVSRRVKRGDSAKVLNVLGGSYSLSHVSNVLAGRRKNTEIIEAAYNLVKRRKAVFA